MITFRSGNSLKIRGKRIIPGCLQVCCDCDQQLLKSSMKLNFHNTNFLQYSSEHRDRKPASSKVTGFVSRPKLNEINRDYIGPADKLSNLRPILRHAPKDETPLERELRLKRIEVEEWNQRFWQTHNHKFITVSCPMPPWSSPSDRQFIPESDTFFVFFRRRKHLCWQTKRRPPTHCQLIK